MSLRVQFQIMGVLQPLFLIRAFFPFSEAFPRFLQLQSIPRTQNSAANWAGLMHEQRKVPTALAIALQRMSWW